MAQHDRSPGDGHTATASSVTPKQSSKELKRTSAIAFMCVTNDAKSPKSPLQNSECVPPEDDWMYVPVIRLRKRELLVTEEPSMTVRRVYDAECGRSVHEFTHQDHELT